MDSSVPGESIHAKRQRLAVVPKAIRCDRIIPCSNCRMAGIACEKVEPASGKRQRSEQATHLEDHIKALESRLQVVESRLKSSPLDLPQHTTPTESTNTPQDNHRVVPVSDLPIAVYEGESSFMRQSTHARDTAETIANSKNTSPGSDLHSAFHSLKSLLEPASQSARFLGTSSHNVAQVALPLPSDVIVTLLRRFQEKKPLFLCSYPVNDLTLLERLCQKVYFPTQAVSAGDVAAMHGILYFVMRESLSTDDNVCEQIDLKAHIAACKQSFEAGIERYDVHVVPSFENTIALTMGVLKAQDEANPLMGCHLISAAVRHCKILGYHRESTFKKDHDGYADHKRRLFWTLYVFDKKNDFDIDVRISAPSSDPAIRPWDEAFYWAIKLADIEGKIYNDLYSATALNVRSSIRVERILDLKNKIEECRRGRHEIEYSKVNEPNMYELASKTWDVLYYSALTSLLRPASIRANGCEIGPECYESARRNLRCHLECFPSYEKSDVCTVADYANWVLLYSSLTPVIVIFLHAIAETNIDDIQLLEAVVTTLKPTCGVSSASKRMYNICSNLCRVARELVESQGLYNGTHNERKNSLQLLNLTQAGHALFPETGQDSLNVDMMSYLTYPEARDMSDLLDSWDTGHLSTMDLFGASF
ncbi:hypothetical protein BDV25DRAFT_169111 [Aspergillus avenaceus]|uniref:Transcription factor domain-containing protein n=1 Tax=Aspergillus avenaceus TaxID=36643 RepID=A0A5N6TM67_ASPAV|nr:hypothetical protein BDV25DRAFT_169111 [Aspergillus avenaceus]